jgi:hypothetical protein
MTYEIENPPKSPRIKIPLNPPLKKGDFIPPSFPPFLKGGNKGGLENFCCRLSAVDTIKILLNPPSYNPPKSPFKKGGLHPLFSFPPFLKGGQGGLENRTTETVLISV